MLDMTKHQEPQLFKMSKKKARALRKKEKKQRLSKLQELRAMVALAFSHRRLRQWCKTSELDLLTQYGESRQTTAGRIHSFKDNDSKILAVAHVDTVQTGTYFGRVVLDEEIIFSPKLDDRLGVYTIMSLLPSLGIRMDVLLTDLEEVGRTTASDFKTDKEYNWIVEFDRCGTGAVSYQYDWGKKLDPYFGKLDHGSFSDISELGDLGVKALNVGVGYQDEHSARCYMSTWDYICNIARFIMMYQELKDTKFPHDESKVDQYRGYYGQMIDRGVLDKRLYDDSVPLAPDGTETAYWCPTCLEIKDIRTLWTEGGSRLCQSCGRETEKLYLPQ